jgi:hypothetical protein
MSQRVASARSSTKGGQPLPRRLVLLVSVAALSLGASLTPAWAAQTIGQHAPSDLGDACVLSNADALTPTVTSGTSYVVPSKGRITSWTTYATDNLGQQMSMKIFRQVSGNTYLAVAHDGPHALTPSGTAGNTFATDIPVKGGDVVGVNSGNAESVFNTCLFSVDDQPYLFKQPGLADGTSGAFTSFTSSNGFRPNVSAVFEPKVSNAFTFGGLARNKKKGTATLTVHVPNPGELTGSGRGVKVAGAAVSGKTVTAGAVKVTIKAKGKKKRKLNKTGKVKVKPKITYTPTGGDPRTQSVGVKLIKH